MGVPCVPLLLFILQSELLQLHHLSLATAMIHKVLKQAGDGVLKATRRPRKGRKRDPKEIAGEQIQRDVGNIGPKLYPCTAIDDCTCLKVIRRYPNKNADRTLAFIEQVITECLVPEVSYRKSAHGLRENGFQAE